MPSIRVEIPPELEEELESQSLQHGLSRQKALQKMLKDFYTDSQSPAAYTPEYMNGFDSIIERQSLRSKLEESEARYDRLLIDYEQLKKTYEISISIKEKKKPLLIRLKFWKREKE